MTTEANESAPEAHTPHGLGEGATSSPSPASLPTPAGSLEAVLNARVRGVTAKRAPRAVRANKAPGVAKNGIGGKKKGVRQAHISTKVKETRDELMLAAHLTGTSMREIANAFGVSPLTVSEGITDAQRRTMFGDARDYVQFRLLPKALRVLDAALDQGNVDVAQKVAGGWGALGGADAPGAAPGGVQNDGSDFETYRLELIRRRSPVHAHASANSTRDTHGTTAAPGTSGPFSRFSTGDGEIIDVERVERQGDHD